MSIRFVEPILRSQPTRYTHFFFWCCLCAEKERKIHKNFSWVKFIHLARHGSNVGIVMPFYILYSTKFNGTHSTSRAIRLPAAVSVLLWTLLQHVTLMWFDCEKPRNQKFEWAPERWGKRRHTFVGLSCAVRTIEKNVRVRVRGWDLRKI